jgi:hypothetical protein
MEKDFLKCQYIGSGIRTDVRNLLNHYMKKEVSNSPYETFTQQWHELNFYQIFNGRHLDFEKAEFTAELFRILVQFLKEFLNIYKSNNTNESKKQFAFIIFLMQGKVRKWFLMHFALRK